MKSLVFWGVAPALLAAVCGSATSASADVVRVVAKVGDTVALDGGVSGYISDFNLGTGTVLPVVGASGHIAYTANVRGTGLTNTNGQTIWISPPATANNPSPTPQLVARTQSQAPLLGNALIKMAGISSPQLNDLGQLVFSSSLSGPGITLGLNSFAYWKYENGGFVQLARDGTATPSQVGSQLAVSSFGEVQYHRRQGGLMTFRSNVTGSGVTYANDRAVWTSDGTLHLVAREGDYAAGCGGATYGDVQFLSNDAGQSAAYATLLGSGVRNRSSGGAPPTDQALWRVGVASSANANCPLTLVARTGNTAPNSGGLYFHTLWASSVKPQMNTAGSLAFAALLCDNTGVGYDSGIYTNIGGSLRAVAVSRTNAPEVGTGVLFGSIFTSFSSQHVFACDGRGNSPGCVIFGAMLSGSGVWSGNNRAVMEYDAATATRRLLLRGGQTLPGVTDDATIVNGSLVGAMRVNRYGDMVCNVQVEGPSVTPFNDRAIVTRVNGSLRTVAREGQEIQNSGGYSIYEIPSTTMMWFNSVGQSVFGATVVNGSGGYPVTALLRTDENGNLRLLTLVGELVSGQMNEAGTASTLRYGVPVAGGPASFSDDGQFVFLCDGWLGSQQIGRSVVSIKIEAESGVTPPPPPPVCQADINRNGIVSNQDLFDFLAGYFAGNGDFDGNGLTELHDLFDFLAAWSAGC